MSPKTDSPHPLVVVGYDGSSASLAAVEVAAERVGSTGRLIVVHAYNIPPEYLGYPYYQDMLDTKIEQTSAVVERLTGMEALDAVDWESDVVAGSPGEVICRVARQRRADEIVVGTRGHGRLRAVLGSVSLDVLHRAHCPVVVIPERMVQDEAPAPAERAAVA